MTLKLKSLAAAGSLFAFAFALPAQADVDGKKFIETLTATLANYGVDAKATAVEAQGANILLKGFSITPQAGDDRKPIDFPDLTLENVTEKDGGFVVGQIAAPANKYPVTDGTWDFGGAVLKNLTVPGNAATGPLGGLMIYDSITMSPSKFVTSDGKDMVKVGQVEATVTPPADGKAMLFDLKPVEIVVDGKAVPATADDAETRQAMAELGLETISMTAAAKGTWNPVDGKIALTEESFDIANVGKLNFAMDLSGYTSDFIKQLQALTKDMSAKDDSAKGMAMMGLMQQLTLNSVSIRFDDASITGKILDMVAKRSGQTKDAIVAQTKGMVPVMLAQLQDVEFMTSVSNAVNAYLDAPKNIEIKAAPAAPVPFAMLMATGMAQPQALIKQIGLTVVANQ